MYAIISTGGKQYKVATGDVIEVEKLEGEIGDTVALRPVMVVDDGEITVGSDKLAAVEVSGELVEHTKGPKIVIHKFKNKSGYHKRQGHRQKLCRVKVTGITVG